MASCTRVLSVRREMEFFDDPSQPPRPCPLSRASHFGVFFGVLFCRFPGETVPRYSSTARAGATARRHSRCRTTGWVTRRSRDATPATARRVVVNLLCFARQNCRLSSRKFSRAKTAASILYSQVGYALLYAGAELHRVAPLRRPGAHRERLVLCCRSSEWRAEYLYCDDEQAPD